MTLLRTETFIPLTNLSVSNEPREFRVTVIPKAEQTRLLQSMEVSAAPPSGPAPCGGKAGEPRVTLQCDGDRVTNIRIQCSCGQIMDLACVYESPSKPA